MYLHKLLNKSCHVSECLSQAMIVNRALKITESCDRKIDWQVPVFLLRKSRQATKNKARMQTLTRIPSSFTIKVTDLVVHWQASVAERKLKGVTV